MLSFVDDSHVLKLCKKSVGFTVRIIKILVLPTEVLQRHFIREVEVHGSFGLNELRHAC